jgi:hypothetical protein
MLSPVNAHAPLEEDDAPRAWWERLVGLAVVAVATYVVAAILNPGMDLWRAPWDVRFGFLFEDTTTNGGDMGAHVWWPRFLADNWFGRLRLSGWAPDWYAGFPAGHFYFPLPAVLIALLDAVPLVPYEVAFKLVTVSGPLLLPAAAYSFARGIRAPWPAPPAFAVAALGTLVQTRTDWQIYGGNLASTLAGEFGFTLALALGLFGLGALARSLDTGRRLWLPAVLIAGAAMSHIVVAFYVALLALLLFLLRRPLRTWPLALSVGGVALALTAVWTVPLALRHDYTQSMRYTRLVARDDWELWGWLPMPGAVERTIEGIVRSMTSSAVPEAYLRMPWWVWGLSSVAIVAAGWYRRRTTLVLLLAAIAVGVLFVQWPEHAVWNARWLPFWVLTWALIAAMGATEIVRLVAVAVRWAVRWVRAGDLYDARARAWIDLARDPHGEVDAALRADAVEVVANREFDRDPPGWEAPPGLRERWVAARAALVSTAALAAATALLGGIGIAVAWDARDNSTAVAPQSWARWNYEGYEEKPAWDEYDRIMDTMGSLAPGRALWEPSSTEGDPINYYGTSLALELLPYWTDGRIGSMEGLYFESSATTSYHFLTVSEVAQHPSNPVRGLVYGTLRDFARGVEHMRMLGVRYYMAWTDAAQREADDHPDLELVAEIPDLDGQEPTGWNVYELRDWALVEGLAYEPVVARTHAGSYEECWDVAWPDPNSAPPELSGWECDAARWWRDGELLDRPWAASGPDEWERIDVDDLGEARRTRLDPVEVTDVVEEPDEISFRVDRVGVPVVVRASFFPNWEANGARGPYRLAPNMMVVVPTEREVSLTYGLTGVDWAGRAVTVLGLVGLVALVRWRAARRFAAGAQAGPALDAPGGPGATVPVPGPPDAPPHAEEPESVPLP